MIDLDSLRQAPDRYRQSLTDRGQSAELVDQALKIDQEWRELTQELEKLQQERNQLTKTKESATQHQDRLKQLKSDIDSLEAKEKQQRLERWSVLYALPNLIDPSVPVGPGESANHVLKTVGEPKLAHGRTHEELMVSLDWLDLKTAASVSGSRFRYLKNAAAQAQMKLSLLAFDFAVKAGFEPIIPPVLAREETFVRGGFLPGGRDEMFQTTDGLFLAGTSEPLLVALSQDKTYATTDLPKRYVGFSTCFRREAGSYGQDIKGMFRVHQFDKVEMVSVTTPEQSAVEHEFLLSVQEKFVQQFDLSYQVVLIGSGDLETKAVKRYDLETWFPGQAKYRETHSASNCTDYQARRFNIKLSPDKAYAHTLNGTLSTERLLLALIENNQDADGRVELPSALV